MEGGNDSIDVSAAVTGGTIYGGSSLGDTAGGNDTLQIQGGSSTSVLFDLAGGTNYAVDQDVITSLSMVALVTTP